jgi:hypothetical protein
VESTMSTKSTVAAKRVGRVGVSPFAFISSEHVQSKHRASDRRRLRLGTATRVPPPSDGRRRRASSRVDSPRKGLD